MSRQTTGLVCAQCGHVNKRAGVFCGGCGEKLLAPELEQAPSAGTRVGKSIARWAVALALAVLVGLMAWPQDVPSVDADSAIGWDVSRRIRALRVAVDQGTDATDIFGQQEINAYLAWRRDETTPSAESRRPTLDLRRLHITLDEPASTFRMRGAWGPIRLSFGVRVQHGEGRLEPDAAWIGHLPVPGPLVSRVAERVAHVFADMDDAQVLFSSPIQIDTRPGRVRIATPGSSL